MTTDPFHKLTANVEQRLLGMKFSKSQSDYDLGYNDAVDDALRAFTEAVEEVREAMKSCNECGGVGNHTSKCVFHGQR